MTTSFPTPRPALRRLLQRWRSSWWPERRRSAWWRCSGLPRSRWCWCCRSHPAGCWGWWCYSQSCCPCSPGGWSPWSLGGTGTLRRNRNIRTMQVFCSSAALQLFLPSSSCRWGNSLALAVKQMLLFDEQLSFFGPMHFPIKLKVHLLQTRESTETDINQHELQFNPSWI